MSRSIALLVTSAFILLSAPTHAAPPPPTTIQGIWLGKLEIGPVKLRLAFHVHRGESGGLVASVDSLDQHTRGMHVDEATFEAQTLRLKLPQIAAAFEGKLDGDRLVGRWTQGQSFPLVMKRVEKLEETRRSQEPRRPFPYHEQEVSISVVAAPLGPQRKLGPRIKLAGTLTLPPGKGPFPAVVFVTGSGPQDRDETIFDHRPFLLLADALTRRGIATLRVDDRGMGKSEGSMSGSTTLDFVEDVADEVAWLAARPEIDKRAIGVIGHSEGGLIAPIVAVQQPATRFVVMLAGTGMTGEQILYAQSELIAKAAGASEASRKRDRADAEALYAGLRKAKTDAEVAAVAKAFIEGDPAKKAERSAASAMLRSPWLRTFLFLDPVPYLESVKQPVLSIAGELDLQVPKENSPIILAALRRGRNADATVKLLPGLNHLFQHTKTGSPTEYAANDETFAPEATKLVVDWVVERAARLRR